MQMDSAKTIGGVERGVPLRRLLAALVTAVIPCSLCAQMDPARTAIDAMRNIEAFKSGLKTAEELNAANNAGAVPGSPLGNVGSLNHALNGNAASAKPTQVSQPAAPTPFSPPFVLGNTLFLGKFSADFPDNCKPLVYPLQTGGLDPTIATISCPDGLGEVQVFLKHFQLTNEDLLLSMDGLARRLGGSDTFILSQSEPHPFGPFSVQGAVVKPDRTTGTAIVIAESDWSFYTFYWLLPRTPQGWSAVSAIRSSIHQ